MDEKSKKKLVFFKNTYELLNTQSIEFGDNIENCIKEQIKYISGETPNNLLAKKALSNAEYILKSMKSSVSCMNDLFNEVKYTEEDLSNKKMSLFRNVYISKCSIVNSIKVGVEIPEFSIEIKNLGIVGVKSDDELIVTLEYDDTIGETKKMNVGFDLNIIGDYSTINISGMYAPAFAYQYILYVELKKDGNRYFKDYLKIINVLN